MPRLLSLRSNILTINALILGLVLALLGTTFYFYEREKRLSVVDASLDQQITPLRGTFSEAGRNRRRNLRAESAGRGNRDWDLRAGSPSVSRGLSGGLEDTEWERRENDLLERSKSRRRGRNYGERFEAHNVQRGYYAKVTNKHGTEVAFQSSNFPDIKVPQGNYQGIFYRFRGEDFRELLNGNRAQKILIGIDLTDFQNELKKLKLRIAGVALALFFGSLGFWYFFITRRLAPLQSIQETALKISGGQLAERIDTSQRGCAKEFDILIRELNQSFAQLDCSFQRQLRFTADASHELKTPLTVLVAQLDLALKGTRSSADYQSILRICSQSCDRLDRIIQELLEISRYDSGSIQLDYQALPLDEVIGGLIEEMTAYAEKRECSLKTDLDSGVVEMDPFRLEQVITNLVNNALQHNDQPIEVTVRSRILGEKAIIEVIDNGKGIQAENLEKLFDRFYQEDSSRTQKQAENNTGLGLAICKAIIELHAGTIEVRSQPSIETVVTIEIPVERPS